MAVRRSPHVPYGGPILDVHTHPQLGADPLMGSRPHRAEDYRDAIGKLDVRAAGALVIARSGDPRGTRALNDQILRLAETSHGRFFPVCSVHPHDGIAAKREVVRVARAGARALKLHPNTQAFDVADPKVRETVRAAAKANLPVLFDAYSPFDANQPGKFVRLAMEVPESRLILAHAHGPSFPSLLVYEVLARYPWWKRNVWIDLSATGPLLSGGPFAAQFLWVLRKLGTDRLLFGSDYPLDDPICAVRGIAQLGLTRTELAQVFFSNAHDLLGVG